MTDRERDAVRVYVLAEYGHRGARLVRIEFDGAVSLRTDDCPLARIFVGWDRDLLAESRRPEGGR